MDPMSAISMANEGIGICYKTVVTLKEIIEAIRKLHDELSPIIRHTERTKIILDEIRSLAQRVYKAGRRDVKVLLDQTSCENVLKKLVDLTTRLAKEYQDNKYVAGFKWWYKHKDAANELCISLEKQEETLMHATMLLNTHATYDALDAVKEIKAKFDKLPKVTSAFQRLTDPVEKSAPNTSGPHKSQPVRVWLAHTVRDGLDPSYVKERDGLADAALAGDWDKVRECITKGDKTYGESWANSFRLLPISNLKKLSFWTPLHQAVYNDAPLSMVNWLVDQGAWCTMRTRRSRYTHQNLTALELAQQLGRTHMYKALSPTIYNTVPHKTLNAVQKQFHELITHQVGEQWLGDQYFWLPRLECLTEMPNGIMLFPLTRHANKNAAYAFRLDGRDLLVMARNVVAPGKTESFRVTEHASKPVEEALLLYES